jgi:hypothetical protein
MYHYVKMVFPVVGPTHPQGSMIFTNLNLHYIRKLSGKSEAFWSSGSKEEEL